MIKSLPRKWKLRCRFDYSDGKASWTSQWDKSGPRHEDMACFRSKDNLLLASIEGKCEETKQIRVLAECAGRDFVNFEWLAAVAVGGASPLGTYQGTTIGLVLVTREERCIVETGGRVSVEMRSEGEKKLHYAGFGR